MTKYIGSQPATSFEAVKKDRFTGLTGTGVTLSHSVSSVQDIVVWVNNVKQDYNNYTVSGTALTLGGSLVSADVVQVLYVGRTFQTVNPSANSVGTSQLDTALDFSSKTITLATNMTNSPSFAANLSGHGSATNDTDTKIAFATEAFDVGGCYNNTSGTVTLNGISTPSYAFAPNVSGKYFFHLSVGIDINSDTEKFTAIIHKNGSVALRYRRKHDFDSGNSQQTVSVSGVLIADGTDDYFEAFVNQNSGSDRTIRLEADRTHFQAYKLIGV
tara:strand:+ start:1343 stop:2158 length:816 start_codon:yes stop_codon:yes gene_type:complete